jgi:diguanylate cyclase (GGDEF)-like protein/PAS domain S-box-containing protein
MPLKTLNKDSSFYQRLLDSLHDGVYVVDRDRVIQYWSQGAEEISGYPRDVVIGRRCGDEGLLMHVDDSGQVLCGTGCPLAATIRDGESREVEAFLHHEDGHRVPVRIRADPIRDESGAIVGAVEIFDENRRRQLDRERISELERLALLDPLTELGNRRYAELQLHSKLGELERFARPFGVLFFDVDQFKRFNDEHGHETGDRVLRIVGRTALASVRAFDSLSRWAGDEFLGLIAYVSPEQLARVGDKIRALVGSSSLTAQSGTLRVTLSVGATMARPDDSAETLVARADRMMYASKTAGGNRLTLDPEPDVTSSRPTVRLS